MKGLDALDESLDRPALLTGEYGEVEGYVSYGVMPISYPGNSPLRRCEIGSVEEVLGQKPCYWFVSDDVLNAVKVRLIAIGDSNGGGFKFWGESVGKETWGEIVIKGDQ